MKTLANHQLIYDKDCPMCKVYSGAFVKAKMLDENGRQNYRDLSEQTKSLLNVNRARNEIALVNFAENKTYYGLDSLLIIIGNSFPLLEKIGRIPLIYWFFSKLYSLVSYNRKQIIPSKNDFLENACVPDFNLNYRLIFIISGILFSSFLLNQIFINVNFQQQFFISFLIILGFYLWQIGFMFKNRTEKIFDYLGNLNTLSIIGTTLFYIVSKIDGTAFDFSLTLVIVLLMIDHFRRVNITKINKITIISFIIYPLFIYILFQQ
ncbi:DCC1-like thiol-disulfide oxidoreductase family protein [Frigoriflavimonas asaccharolytica]|uniref:DUF393 domain-containing protein n=1 Tax=Frigoriflavimonas asaccharolytica TaxID=2735899 RepID=A0A8J8G4Q5_9FLAO|nr:DCC1-like thiol-disulfide oxidoreductase family protein [Frigoriflavimonas asaccharolytica]NRS91256.1 hypothetical protein [Frigoriflavimonas asaccharolytica]